MPLDFYHEMAEEPKEETQEPTDLRSAIEAAMEPEEPEKAPETSAQVEPTEPELGVPPALPQDDGEHGSVETAEETPKKYRPFCRPYRST